MIRKKIHCYLDSKGLLYLFKWCTVSRECPTELYLRYRIETRPAMWDRVIYPSLKEIVETDGRYLRVEHGSPRERTFSVFSSRAWADECSVRGSV